MTSDPRGRPVIPPIIQSVNFAFESCDALEAASRAGDRDHFYTRLGNPGTARAERRIADLEGFEDALLFASGMGAIAGTALGLMQRGDRVVVDSRIYGGAASFFRHFAPRMGVELVTCDSEAALLEALPGARFIYCESPTNPLMEILDLARIAEAARAAGAISIFDGTLATPIAQRPGELGFDLVVHSATKAMNGHHDVLAGVVTGRKELIDPLVGVRLMLGATLDPHASFLLLRGLETLELRVKAQHAAALELATRLAARRDRRGDLVRVLYPGLPDHPRHELARRQMTSFGSVITLELEGGVARSRAIADALQHFAIAGSLCGTDSLVALPRLSTHMGWSDDELAAVGLAGPILRLSIGLEPVSELFADLTRALDENPA